MSQRAAMNSTITGAQRNAEKKIVLTGDDLVFLVSVTTNASETLSGINQL
jgi:hypothetical protein